MHIAPHFRKFRDSQGARAFSIIEALIAMAVCGLMFVALYGGISSSFSNIRLSRENLRGTQVLLEKMEVIRLLTWDQINSNGFVVTNFSAPLFPSLSSSSNRAAFFYGDIDIQQVAGPGTPPPPSGHPPKGKPGSGGGGSGTPPSDGSELNANYSGDLKLVTVTIRWKSGSREQSRRLSTYVSRFGIQNYVYN